MLNPVLNGEYELISQLGEGSTAVVWKARSIHDHEQMVAIKILKAETKKEMEKYMKE